jgi:sugar lactone lactonase YvrE
VEQLDLWGESEVVVEQEGELSWIDVLLGREDAL